MVLTRKVAAPNTGIHVVVHNTVDSQDRTRDLNRAISGVIKHEVEIVLGNEPLQLRQTSSDLIRVIHHDALVVAAIVGRELLARRRGGDAVADQVA